MARDHYLPACVIGRFSDGTHTSARERIVFVLRRGADGAFQTKAENIGVVNDLYRLSSPLLWGDDSITVDPQLNGYEPSLPYALNRPEHGRPVDMTTWLRTLVPYVTSLFVRGRDFIPRFMARSSVAAGGKYNTIDNANGARLIELERLLAPVCCARWIVMHKIGAGPFVLNDLGMTGTIDGRTGESGWAIPIGRSSILGAFPRKQRTVAMYRQCEWRAIIEHGRLDLAQAAHFNKAMAQRATSYVLGPSRDAVEKLAPMIGEYDDPSEMMEAWPFDHRTKLAHTRDWHRLVTATTGQYDFSELSDLENVNGDTLAQAWCPPTSLSINQVRPFPTGLVRNGNLISLTLESPRENFGQFLGSGAEQQHAV